MSVSFVLDEKARGLGYVTGQTRMSGSAESELGCRHHPRGSWFRRTRYVKYRLDGGIAAENCTVKDETSVKTIMAAQYRTMNRGGHSIYEEVRKAGYEP